MVKRGCEIALKVRMHLPRGLAPAGGPVHCTGGALKHTSCSVSCYWCGRRPPQYVISAGADKSPRRVPLPLRAPTPQPPPELHGCPFSQVAGRIAGAASECAGTRAAGKERLFERPRMSTGVLTAGAEVAPRHCEVRRGTNDTTPQCHTPQSPPAVDNCEVMVETFPGTGSNRQVEQVSHHYRNYPQARRSLWITRRCRVFHTCV